jgi:hypothetical protein
MEGFFFNLRKTLITFTSLMANEVTSDGEVFVTKGLSLEEYYVENDYIYPFLSCLMLFVRLLYIYINNKLIRCKDFSVY